MIDIFNIEPSVVSRDLSEKSFLIYGDKKSGKTSNAVKFPQTFLAGFEKGWNAISGVKAVPINKWSEWKQIIKSLQTPKALETYKTVIMDTADLAYDLCVKFICMSEGVSHLDETTNKRGYKMAEKEFESTIIDLIKYGYTFVAISHAETKTMKDEKGEQYERIQPTIDKRGLKVISRTVDIIGYSKVTDMEDGSKKTYLLMRGSQYYEAGSRFKYTPDYIEFTHENLLNCIADAIEKQEKEDGSTVVETKKSLHVEREEQDFDEIMTQVGEICGRIVEKDEKNAKKITKVVEKHLGKGKKVSECDESQVDIVVLVYDDLKELAEQIL